MSTPIDRGRRPAKDAAPIDIDQVSNLPTMLRPSTGPGSVWIVTYVVSGGQPRRSAYMTRSGAVRAAERHREAGRPALVTPARLAPAAVGDETSPVARARLTDQVEEQAISPMPVARRADLVLRIAWLRAHAWEMNAVDPSGLLSAQLRDLADVLEGLDRGCEL